MVSDDDIEVDLRNKWLGLYKNNKGPRNAMLTQRILKEVEENVNPKTIEVVKLKQINLGLTCEGLFGYVSKCVNSNRLIIDNVTDGTEKNGELSCRLWEVVDRLHNLIQLDIRHTYLFEGGRQVLYSISHPDLRVLSLYKNKLYGGEELKAALTRLPQLRLLQLDDSGFGGEELLCGLTQLPSSSPLLQSLLVGGHDFSSGGNQLVEVIEALPQLRILNIGRCQLASSAVCSILLKISRKIEILAYGRNGPVTDRKPLIFNHINECKSLTYMTVSSSQWSPAELSQLNSLLSANGGGMLVDPTPTHDLWDSYAKHVTRIRDQCLSRLPW